MRHNVRKRLFIDRSVQGSLLVRVAAYWMGCVLTIELLSLSWQIAIGPQQPTYFDYFLNQDWRPCCVRLVASTLLLGPILYDMLRLSNRFAGPAYAMRRMLRKVIAGGAVEQVHLRENDYWHGFAADLNVALSCLASQRTPAPKEKLENPRATLVVMETDLRQSAELRLNP